MARHTLTCDVCGRQWARRRARFCGVCGAVLPEVADTGRRRGLSGPVRTAIGAAALVAVVAVVGTGAIELPTTSAPPDPTVDLSDEPAGLAQLSPEQEQELRDAVDPDRLRCEPRGCERWRTPRPGGAHRGISGGVVPLDDGTVLVLGEDDAQRAGRLLVAIDGETGERRWERVIVPSPATQDLVDGTGWLTAGPHGALLLADGGVASLDQDGEVVWRWTPTHRSGLSYRPWAALPVGDDVLAVAELVGQPGDRTLVVSLDAETGTPNWTHEAREVALLDPDLVLTLGTGGRLGALDLADGQLLWELPVEDGEGLVHRVGPWVAHRRQTGSHDLLDPVSGEVVEQLTGYLVTTAANDAGRVATIFAGTSSGDDPPDDGAAQLGVVVLSPSGQIDWQLPLGEIDPWWSCCHLEVTDDSVTVDSARYHRTFDVETGVLVEVERNDPVDPPSGQAPPDAQWYAPDGTDVQVAWHRDALGLDLRRGESTVTIRGGRTLLVDSFDPLIVTDGRTLMAIRFPDDDAASSDH